MKKFWKGIVELHWHLFMWNAVYFLIAFPFVFIFYSLFFIYIFKKVRESRTENQKQHHNESYSTWFEPEQS